MTAAVRTFMRPDELQWVTIAPEHPGFRLIETTELWHAPQPIEGDYCYFHYPTVIAARPFATLAEALDHVREHYPWADTDA